MSEIYEYFRLWIAKVEYDIEMLMTMENQIVKKREFLVAEVNELKQDLKNVRRNLEAYPMVNFHDEEIET
jgi:hypothetical protein